VPGCSHRTATGSHLPPSISPIAGDASSWAVHPEHYTLNRREFWGAEVRLHCADDEHGSRRIPPPPSSLPMTASPCSKFQAPSKRCALQSWLVVFALVLSRSSVRYNRFPLQLDQDKDIKPGEMYGIQLKKQGVVLVPVHHPRARGQQDARVIRRMRTWSGGCARGQEDAGLH
jgi:hypothetical protein